MNGIVVVQNKIIICRCGKHGRIVGLSGYPGPEFCTKDAALDTLARGAEHGEIGHVEQFRLYADIHNLALPDNVTDVDPALLWAVELCNRAAAMGHTGNRHKYVTGNIDDPVNDMPADLVARIAHELASRAGVYDHLQEDKQPRS